MTHRELTNKIQSVKNEIKAIEARGEWWGNNLEDLANEDDAARHEMLTAQLAKLEAQFEAGEFEAEKLSARDIIAQQRGKVWGSLDAAFRPIGGYTDKGTMLLFKSGTGAKAWVAEIANYDEASKFGFEREFLDTMRYTPKSEARMEWSTKAFKEGKLYEYMTYDANTSTKYRNFFAVSNGNLIVLSKEDAIDFLAADSNKVEWQEQKQEQHALQVPQPKVIYNRSAVMKRAWQILRRRPSLGKSGALKQAWAEHKAGEF